MQNISPNAEPISWGLVAASLIDIAIAHGWHPDGTEQQLIAYLLPFILAGLWARFRVYAPDTVEAIIARVRRYPTAPDKAIKEGA